MSHRVLLLLLALGVFCTALSLSSEDAEGAYTPHAPIRIEGDVNFTSANGVVSGNGSAADPYVISGWELTCSTVFNVRVENTTKHFVVRDCHINATGKYGLTILVRWADHVWLDRVSIVGGQYELRIYDCDEVRVTNVTMRDSGYLNIKRAAILRVYDTNVSGTNASFDLTWCDDAELVRCECHGSERIGFQYYESFVRTRWCNATRNAGGLHVTRGVNCTFDQCNFKDNTGYDVALQSHHPILRDVATGPNGFSIDYLYNVDLDSTVTVSGKPLRFYLNQTRKTVSVDTAQIIMYGCDNFTLEDMTISDGALRAIAIYECDDVTIRNVTVRDSVYGLTGRDGNRATITDCTFDARGLPSGYTSPLGYAAEQSLYIANVTCLGGNGTGMACNAPDLTVRNCTLVSYSRWGIYVADTEANALIEDCDLSGGEVGIYLKNGINHTIRDCTVADCSEEGVNANANGILVQRCEVRNSTTGIRVSGSDEVLVLNNRITDCSDTGLLVWFSDEVGNRVENNTVLRSGVYGIHVNSGRALHLDNNTVMGARYGIWLYQANIATIEDCQVSGCDATGLTSERSLELLVLRCDISDAGIGVNLTGSQRGVNLTECRISDGDTGLIIGRYTDLTSVFFNTFTDCTGYAFEMAGGRDSMVHHNDFIRCNYDPGNGTYNGPQALGTDDHAYDNGMEGNYWADYQGRYPSAARVGLRQWDTPYVLAGADGSRDRYPLAFRVDFVPPVADAGDDRTVPQNTTVQLDASGSADDVGIVSYNWSLEYLGEEVNLTGVSPSFTFDMPGVYYLNLVVSDRFENEGWDQVVITVLDTQRPVAVAGTDIVVDAGIEFQLDGTGSTDNVGVVSYKWTIDPDGLNLTFNASVITTSIDQPGLYEVVLEVSDAAGNRGEDRFNLTVGSPVPPVADAGADIEVDQGATVTLDGSGSTDDLGIIAWAWTFEYDGSTRTLMKRVATFRFDIPGTYAVTLTVTDTHGLTATDVLQVVVRDTQAPVVRGPEDVAIDQHGEVSLEDAGSTDNVGIVTRTWTFTYGGEEVTLSGDSVFTFDDAGVFEVTYRVEDAAGNWAEHAFDVLVRDTTQPVAVAGPDVTIDMHGAVVLEDHGSSDNVGIATHRWTFTDGDGEHTYWEEHTYSFETPGTYAVTLRVTDLAGNWAEDSFIVEVRDTQPPLADAGADIVVDQGTEVLLDASFSSDNVGIVSYRWTFIIGDVEVTLEGETVAYTFIVAGTFRIDLTVTDGAENSAVDWKEVTARDVEDPVAAVTGDVLATVGTEVTVSASPSHDNVGIASYSWSFTYKGLDKVFDGEVLRFLFYEAGAYDVTLVVTDTSGNKGSVTFTVTVRTETVNVGIGPIEDGKGDPVGGARVEITINGTTMSGRTGEDGLVTFQVPWEDLVPPIDVTVAKGGWKKAEFQLDVDGSGDVSGDVPSLVREEESPGVGVAGAVLVMALVGGIMGLRRRH